MPDRFQTSYGLTGAKLNRFLFEFRPPSAVQVYRCDRVVAGWQTFQEEFTPFIRENLCLMVSVSGRHGPLDQ